MYRIKSLLSNCGCGRGHVTHFYISDLENLATASSRCIGVVDKLVHGQLVDYM